jgi:rod shape-determining protein MreC
LLLRRRIRENRSTIGLGILVLLSLTSLASGTKGSVVSDGIHTALSVVASPFWKTLHAIEAGTSYVSGLVLSYDSARKEADALQAELHALLLGAADHDELEAENERLRAMLQFQREQPGLALLPGEVMRVPGEVISRSAGMLTVDRGSLHGVREFMCAMTKDGVVGVVTRVEPTLCKVATLHSAECRVGAMIERNRVLGVVHGSGNVMSHVCTMRYIDLKDDVRVGDTVVTSGGSGGSVLYPPGCPIGTVTGTREENALQRAATLEPAADPYRLDEVFLVMRAQTPEETLAGPQRESDIVSMAHSMPDDRPIQERYAP